MCPLPPYNTSYTAGCDPDLQNSVLFSFKSRATTYYFAPPDKPNADPFIYLTFADM